jgi:cytochrome P450
MLSESRCPFHQAIPRTTDDSNSLIDRLAVGHPHELYAELNAQPDIRRVELKSAPNASAWVITRFSDVVRVLKDAETFSSASGAFAHPLWYGVWGAQIREPLLNNMHETDGTRHSNYRRLLSSLFSDQAIRQSETDFRTYAENLLEPIFSNHAPQELSDVGPNLTRWALDRFLGIPERHHDSFLLWGRYLMSGRPLPGFATAAEVASVFRDILVLARQLLRSSKDDQRDTAFGRVSAAFHRGEIAEDEGIGYFILLVIAGAQTTAQTIGLSLLAFASFPDEFEKLRLREDLIDRAVDELLRWTTVTKHFYRTVTSDVEISGTELKQGDVVTLWLSAANHDNKKFDDSHKFRIDRENSRDHVAFGMGRHFCLGWRLAHMEIEIFLSLLRERVKRVDLIQPVTLFDSPHLAGLSSLVCRFA